MASPYRPPSRSRPGAFLRVAGIGAASALAVALIWHLVDRFAIELVVLAPAMAGLGIGVALAGEIRRSGLSSPRLAAAVAAGSVLLALAVHMGLRYRQHRQARLAELGRAHEVHVAVGLAADSPHPDVRVTPADFARHRFGLDADVDPMSGLPAALGPVGTIAVYAVEVFLCLGIAIVVARMSASEPACPRCGAWRVHERLGDAGFGIADDLVARLVDGEPAAAAGLLAPPDTRERIRLALLTCPSGHDGDAGVLRVMEHRRDRRRRERARHVADLRLSADERDHPRRGRGRRMSEPDRPDPPEPVAPRPRRRQPAGGMQNAIRRRVKDLARDVEEKAAGSSRRRVQVLLASVRMVVHVLRQYFRDRCPQQASSLSFQAVLSVVPLMAVTLAVLRATSAMDAESTLVDFIAAKVVPISRVELAAKLRSFSENVTFQSLGLLGLLGTIILAFLMVNTLEGVVNRIWRSEHRRSLTQKFVVFYATATIGPFILATSLYQAARFGLTSGWSGFVFSFGATLGGFFLLNYFLPATKVRARAAFVGSAAATILFELAKHGFSLYVSGFAFDRYSGIYGALAVVPLWLVWIYYSWLVVLFGVEITYSVQNVHLIQRLDRRTASSLETEILERVNGVVATRVMVAICRAYTSGDKVLARDAVADRFDLSDDAVDRLLLRLKDAGLVLEVEGDAVGLIPSRPPDELTVADVLAAFRDNDVRGLAAREAEGPLDRLLRELEEDESRRTSDVTLAELV